MTKQNNNLGEHGGPPSNDKSAVSPEAALLYSGRDSALCLAIILAVFVPLRVRRHRSIRR